MNYEEALTKLQAISQEHLLQFFRQLTDIEKSFLLKQIQDLDVEMFKKQQALILEKKLEQKEEFEPFTNIIKEKDVDIDLGKELLSKGQYGCLLIAGGQGTRLQFSGPKGTFPVSAVKKKTLFQIFAEKTLAAGKLAERPLPIAIMTSEENDSQVKFFFKDHDYFGLLPEQVSFFSQSSLPFLNLTGDLFLENVYTIATGPDGNGSSLQTFFKSGIWEKWLEKGVRFVNYVLIDNPLADPFDMKLLSFQSRQKAEIVVKCIRRETPEENVGVLVNKKGLLRVVEYSEMSEHDRFIKNTNGNLMHSFANISLFSFSMDFIKKLGLSKEAMPLHAALKAIPPSIVPNGWKFEKFIFDVFQLAEHIEVIEYSRKNCFAPLKNLSGNNSLETVQKLCQDFDYKTICRITGRQDPFIKPFEIAQEFHYPTDELIEKWKGKELASKHYIEE